MARRTQKCSAIKGQKAGRNREHQCRANLSMLLGREGKGDEFKRVADPLRSVNAGSPHCRPAIQCLCNSQNVAGLWLKYGVRSVKVDPSRGVRF
jgi:hypothetical protein